MYARSNGRYSVVRGTATNDYGDELPVTTPTYTRVRGSVIERNRKVFNEDSGRVETVRYLTGRFPHGTDIQLEDRILNESTGAKYLVAGVALGSDMFNHSDIVVDLLIN